MGLRQAKDGHWYDPSYQNADGKIKDTDWDKENKKYKSKW